MKCPINIICALIVLSGSGVLLAQQSSAPTQLDPWTPLRIVDPNRAHPQAGQPDQAQPQAAPAVETQVPADQAQPQVQPPQQVQPQTQPSDQGLPLPEPSGFTQAPAGQSNRTSPQAEPPEPELKADPTTVLRDFEPSADSEYHLGRGDAITVDFSGHPEMQAKLVVGPDGRISLPLAGEVQLDGRTRSEAGQAIEAAMGAYYKNMSAHVTVTQYTSNRVMVLGAVEHPGVVSFEGTPTLLEAITRVGVMQSGTNRIGQLPEECAIYRGSDQVAWVNLRSLIASGNAMANMRLRRDDVVYVPSLQERFVSVLGEVQHAGPVALMHNSTLASVLSEVGGITDHAGNNPRIQIVDTETGTSQFMKYEDLMRPGKMLEITLKPGEIVYVPRSGFYKATYVMERLNPLVSVMSMAYYGGIL